MTLRADSLNSKIDKAYDDLRGIHSNISSITGRTMRDRISGPLGGGPRRRSEPDGHFFSDRRVQAVGDKRKLVITADNDSLSKRGRYQQSKSLEAADEGNADEDRRRPTLSSAVVVPTIETKSRAAAITDLKRENKGMEGRNRRMFASLLVGTLRRFEKDEKKVSEVEQVQATKQREVERRLEEKRQEERTKMNRERDELEQQRVQKEREILRLKRDKAIVQYAEEKEAHYKRLQNFIQTVAKPSLFYAPAKHTIRTLELQKQSAKKIDELIAERREQMKSDLSSSALLDVDLEDGADSKQVLSEEIDGLQEEAKEEEMKEEEKDEEEMKDDEEEEAKEDEEMKADEELHPVEPEEVKPEEEGDSGNLLSASFDHILTD
ncbi:hypothetical protein L596_011874 [Steinernema carpocapsae]|uniref:Pinin/SDK/MemA protein domain-containing protein n=1 Tax=Steinernema carpocapsae TaxID=34508 RepID=A0A4U5NW86_STECR|nr:hypothetical protein L596_011874 [Steinernema carpocapsae]